VLRIITGPSEYAVRERIIAEIARKARDGVRGQILLVPEQYSHAAERRLCSVCGDSISIHAQVLSFHRLASRVFEQTGGLARQVLDSGGRLLTMAIAFRSVREKLRYYSSQNLRPELCLNFLDAVKELKNSEVKPESLFEVSADLTGSLGAKLQDIALLYDAYNALTMKGAHEPEDEMTLLADALEQSSFAEGRPIYVAGFTDFTSQQQRIVRSLMESSSDFVIGLSGTDSDSIGRKTMSELLSFADLAGIGSSVEKAEDFREIPPDLRYLARSFFDYAAEPYPGDAPSIVIASASDIESECDLAACTILRLVRERGYRFNDFIVAVRGFEKYRSMLSGVFEEMGVAVYTGGTKSILNRPEMVLPVSALKIIERGFEYEDVFKYLKTGLAGLTSEETDVLENYVLQWNIRGSGWTRNENWRFHPEGKGGALNDRQNELLEYINLLRQRVLAPLLALRDRISGSRTAGEYCEALYDFIEMIGLRESVEERYEILFSRGALEEADEYRQLWEIFCAALDQFVFLAGDVQMSPEEFGSFLEVLLSQYSAGIIPVSVDRVTAGDLARMRGVEAKCLFILGAVDGSLPAVEDDSTVFTRRDRRTLHENGIDIGIHDETGIEREMDIIRAALNLPSQMLFISCADSGEEARAPSFVFHRIRGLFPGAAYIDAASGEKDYLMQSVKGCFTLACQAYGSPEKASAAQLAAAGALAEHPGLKTVLDSVNAQKNALSPETARKLYGNTPRLTPTRVEKFRSCKFAYFMQYGLKAKPRLTGVFEAQDAGTYMHFILQNVCREAKDHGGFSQVEEEQLDRWISKYTGIYVDRMLDGYHEKSQRYIYLFRRLERSASRIVKDLAEELSDSSFEPLAFELTFGPGADIPAIEPKDAAVSVVGTVDRVDGWIHDGKLYIRVVDYKTGKKDFDFTDIYNGLSLQMLIYLFALQKNGRVLFDGEIVPAGVLYVPARDPIVNLGADHRPEQADSAREKELRRKGLLLESSEIITAMEHKAVSGGKFLPVRIGKDGSPEGNVASLARFRELSDFIDDTLKKIGEEIILGRIETDPYFSGYTSACQYCDYSGACRFERTKRTPGRYFRKIDPDFFWRELDSRYKQKEGVS